MNASSGLDTLIIESASDFAILAMDLSGTVIRWSRGAEIVLGWPRSEALGQPGLIIFCAEDRAAGIPEKEMAASLECGRSLDERWHVRKDQSRFWASGEMMALRDPSGAAIGFLKIVRDRTERWLEEQKRLTLAKLGEGLANMVDPAEMATLASDLVRTSLNAAGACYATVAEDLRVEGRSIAPQCPHAEARLRAVCGTCLAKKNGFGEAAEAADCIAEDAGGAGAFCVVPLVESRRLVAMFALVNDGERRWTAEETDFIREIALRARFAIERRRAEQALRELASSLEKQVERRLAERNRLWANTRDLMAIVDRNGTLNEINPAWGSLLGWETHDLVGRSLFSLTDERGAALLRQILARPERAQCQVDLKSADQRVRRLEWSVSRSDDVAYLVGRDVTDQLEIEGRLRQSQKMEAIGQLTGGLAHDFNNLLAGIIGSIDLLRLRIESNRRDDIERYLQAARTAAHRATALTHRLLTFSRQQPVDPKPIDMNRLVAGMEELLRRTLHVRVELELKLDATCLVMSDAHQLENAVLNLVINARDAMPGGGKIVIATEDCGPNRPLPPRSNSREPAANFACLSVADTGEGIPAEVVSKVFEPFFTTKPAGQGTGLGLAMIYGFVKQMNGDIDLETAPGRGTTMRLFFPCARRQETQTASAAPASYPRGAGQRILVVEDDAVVRTTIIEMLHELGYAPEGAENSQAAMERLHDGGRFDGVITDWGLPGLTGGELAERVRRQGPDLPICFLTGYDSEDAGIGTLRPNETLLTKPVGIDTLARVLGSMMERAR